MLDLLSNIVKIISCFCLLSVPAFAATEGGGMPSFVHDIGISLLLAGLLGVVFARFKIPSLAAFLVAGILLGPAGFAQVTDPDNIDTIAQLGFILLLFMIGLEIDLKKILGSGKTIIVTGIVQYPLCILFGIVATKFLLMVGIGSTVLAGDYAPIYIGIVIAGSSTLLVVKLFQENFELDTQPGRIALGLLIFQDIWAIIAILIQPNLDDPQIMPILMSFLGITILIALSVLISRYLASIGFRWIAKSPELILIWAISWCFVVVFLGMSFDTVTETLFGINLHIAVGSGMGALIAGATIASLPYSTEIITKVGVVKDFLVTLFFVGLGMSIPVPQGLEVPILAVIIAILAIIARQLLFFPVLYWLGSDQRNAEVSSIRLAQTSEFGLVIAFLGIQYGHLSGELSSAIIFAFVINALLTSPLYKQAYSLHQRIKKYLVAVGFKAPEEAEEEIADEYDLALLGFYYDASSLLHQISIHDPERIKKTLVIDFNVALHDKIRATGAHVHYGDLSNSETLLHAGIDKAKVIMCTIPDDLLRGINNAQLVKAVRGLCPDAIIVANAVDTSDSDAVYQAGADYVYMSRVETARTLEGLVLHAISGTLKDHKQKQNETHGHLHERNEVIA